MMVVVMVVVVVTKQSNEMLVNVRHLSGSFS